MHELRGRKQKTDGHGNAYRRAPRLARSPISPSEMVVHPFSPQMLPSDYSTPPYASSQDTSRKRKRQRDHEDSSPNEFVENDHVLKKKRDEVVAPLTPTSPPSSFLLHQRLTPPSEQDVSYLHNPVEIETKDITQASPSSYIAYPPHEHCKPSSSDGDSAIPSQNLFLRNLHLNSRAYQFNQNRDRLADEDEEMWEEEEERVAGRYSAMNKVLGSRRTTW
jgi:hypothetical protein